MVLLWLAGCRGGGPDSDATCEGTPHARSPASSEAPAATAVNRLGLGVLAAQTEENAVVAPLDVSMALGMTLAGAGGATRDQLLGAFGWATDPADLHGGLASLTADLDEASASGPDCATWTFQSGQATFFDERLDVLPAYEAALADPYAAEPHRVDFASDPEGAADAINAWTSDQTGGHIDHIVEADMFPPTTLFALASATYFHGAWATPFDPDLTAPAPFHLADGTVADVDMMRSTGSYRFASLDGASVVELPYAGDDVVMDVVVPVDDGGLPAVIAGLDPAALDAALADAAPEEVDLFLPRFDVRWHASLVPSLVGLGVTDLFDAERADLSGIATTPGLYVYDVVHEAWVHVDEAGTEAAAATDVVGGDDTEPPGVFADHPFAYVVRDRVTGVWLFVGRLDDPR